MVLGNWACKYKKVHLEPKKFLVQKVAASRPLQIMQLFLEKPELLPEFSAPIFCSINHVSACLYLTRIERATTTAKLMKYCASFFDRKSWMCLLRYWAINLRKRKNICWLKLKSYMNNWKLFSPKVDHPCLTDAPTDAPHRRSQDDG